MATRLPTDPPEHGAGPAERAIALTSFRAIERLLLLMIVVMTLAAAAFEIQRVVVAQSVNLADILLMFLYAEVIGMIAVFYGGRESPFVYPIFIAITALARLIVLQGKDMDPLNIVFEAASILILSLAVLILGRRRDD